MITKTINDEETVHQIMWSKAYSIFFELGVNMKIFDFLSDGPKSFEELTEYCGFSPYSTRVLLQYLCGLGALKMENNNFHTTPVSRFLASSDNQRNILNGFNIASSADELYRQLFAPSKQPWYQINNHGTSITSSDGISPDFFKSQQRHQWRIKQGIELASLYNFEHHRKLIDIGGASGGWCVGIQQKFPHLRCTVFDLPEACNLTKDLIESDKNTSIEFIGGDIFNNNINFDSDVALLANVLHDWNKTDCLKILSKVYEALPKKAVVMVYEFYLNDNWDGPMEFLYHSLTVLGPGTESGWQPSYKEMEDLLIDSGFKNLKREKNLIIGTKA
jgi:3-hydroxy-5-methyl-1-naphthoate 3-O-methyltransferase